MAIEANPRLADRVRNRLSADVENRRLTILELAISDRAGLADFWVTPAEDTFSSLIEEYLPAYLTSWSGKERIQVKYETLDAILQEYGIPYHLKIDIEGSDINCIKAMRGFQGKPKYVSFECRVWASLELGKRRRSATMAITRSRWGGGLAAMSSSSPSLWIIARTASTWPCGRLRVMRKVSAAGTKLSPL